MCYYVMLLIYGSSLHYSREQSTCYDTFTFTFVIVILVTFMRVTVTVLVSFTIYIYNYNSYRMYIAYVDSSNTN